jgi:transposase
MGHLLHSIRTTKGRRTECANVQIGVLEEVLPSVKPVGRNPRDRREVINGIRWWVRTGAPWRDVPQRDGPWGDLLLPVRTWQRNGIWADVRTKLQTRADAKGPLTWAMSVDSTVASRSRD